MVARSADVAITDGLPCRLGSATTLEVVVHVAARRVIACVTRSDGAGAGVLTTGYISRLMEHEENVFPVPVTKVMNKNPKIAEADELGSAVVYRMETHGIIAMPVLGANKQVVGVIPLHDQMRAGVAQCGTWVSAPSSETGALR